MLPTGWRASAASHLRSLARRFVLVTTVLISVVCGLVAVAFHRYFELTRRLLIEPALEQDGPIRVLLVLAVPPLVFVTLALIIRRFAPRAVGANLARVRIAYNGDGTTIGPRTMVATFFATPISLGAGAPLGPEGPIVVVTSGLAAMAGRALRMPRNVVRGMIPVGVAAGISAVFNAPMTGVVFALEEIFGTAQRGLLGGVLVGAVAASVVQRLIMGGQPLLAAPFSTWSGAHELFGFAIVGVIAGIVSGSAIASTHWLKRWWTARMPSMAARAAVAGVLVGAAGLVAPSTLGVGYESVSLWLHGGGDAQTTAIAFAVKTIAFVIAVSAGVLGGTFAPSLFIGTALGAAIGHSAMLLLPGAGIDPKAYAIVGMGAVFAGVLRSPIAAVVIVVELTRDYELMVPVMLAVALAVSISRWISRLSMVEQQMVDEGHAEGEEAADPLARVKASEVMSTSTVSLEADAPLAEAMAIAAAAPHRFYPVVDREQRLAGIIKREVMTAESADGRRTRELMEQPSLVANATDPLLEVVKRMQLHGADRCPVIDAQTRRVVGFISPSDILRARMQHGARHEPRFELFE